MNEDLPTGAWTWRCPGLDSAWHSGGLCFHWSQLDWWSTSSQTWQACCCHWAGCRWSARSRARTRPRAPRSENKINQHRQLCAAKKTLLLYPAFKTMWRIVWLNLFSIRKFVSKNLLNTCNEIWDNQPEIYFTSTTWWYPRVAARNTGGVDPDNKNGRRFFHHLSKVEPATLPTTAFFVAVAFGSTPRFRMLSTTFLHNTYDKNRESHLSETLVKFHRYRLCVPDLEAAQDLKWSHSRNLKSQI